MSAAREIRIGTGRGLALAVLLGALALLAGAIQAPPAHAVAATGSISGTVTDAISEDPVQGIEVCAYSEEVEFSEDDCQVTNDAGKYVIPGLPTGTYFVEFWPRQLNYLAQLWEGASRFQDADPVSVGKTEVSGIDAALARGGEIAGTVTRSGQPGEGIDGIEVCAYPAVEDGSFHCARTDSEGDYVIPGIPTGSYKVEFWPGEKNLVPQYWDHVRTWNEATPVDVSVGFTVDEIDAALEVGGIISGSVVEAAGGGGVDEVFVCARLPVTGEYVGCGLSNGGQGGHYVIGGLPPGSYSVGFSEEFETGLPEDGFETQFFNDKPGFAEADPVLAAAGQNHSGVDASLKRIGEITPPAFLPPLPGTLPLPKPAVTKIHCGKGFEKRKIRKRFRCVKRKHHRHHPRR